MEHQQSTKKNIKFSIITVSYNSEQTIERTIQSVLNQQYPNLEYIIIDGGSNDNTINIIKKYEDKISYWISEPDKGIYDAMNKGLSKAHGDLIGILNSDDWYSPNILWEIATQYIKYGDDNIFHGNIRFCYKNGSNKIAKPCLKLNKLYKGTLLFHPTIFVPKNIYIKYGKFDTKYKIAADYDFILRCYINHLNFVHINQVITNMSMEGESNKNIIKGFKEVMHIALESPLPKMKIYYYFIRNSILYKTKALIQNFITK